MTEQQLRDEMVQIGASLFNRGYATGSAGNLSLLLPDGNLLATPTGSCLGELQAQRLSVVTLQGEWIAGDKPSKEIAFHRAVYLHNPACKAIVHLHSHYLTALSCLQGLDPHNCIRPLYSLRGDAGRRRPGGSLLPTGRRPHCRGAGRPGAAL